MDRALHFSQWAPLANGCISLSLQSAYALVTLLHLTFLRVDAKKVLTRVLHISTIPISHLHIDTSTIIYLYYSGFLLERRLERRSLNINIIRANKLDSKV